MLMLMLMLLLMSNPDVRGFDKRMMRRLLGIGDGPEVILGGDKDGAKRRNGRVMGRLEGTGNRG